MSTGKLATFAVLFAFGVAAILLALQLAHTPPSRSVVPTVAGERTASAPNEFAQLESSTAPPAESSAERQAFAGDGECRLFGVVVDELEHPIAGVTVKLSANDGALVREARTGSDGRYELRAPLPGEGLCELTFSSEQLFSEASRRLWRKKPSSALHAGDNDLGRTTLEFACAIEGRVTLRGAPVPYAHISAVWRNFTRGSTYSAADGSYRLGPLALGQYRVVAADAAAPGDVELAQAEISRSEAKRVDLVVPWASFISGRVVDASGAPCAQATVRSKSASGSTNRVTADAQGRFCVPLASSAPHALLASRSNERVGFDQGPGTSFAPGSSDAVLVLSELPHARLQVIDAQTHAPIERFGLRLARPIQGTDRGSMSSALQASAHARGECVEAVESGERIVQVSAPGYESRELLLDERATHDDAQVIEMQHGATLLGHVTIEGQSTSLGSARLALATREVDGSGGESDNAPVIIDRDQPSLFVAHHLMDGFDFNGGFRFEDLVPGTYDLALRGKAGARAFRPAVQIARGQVLDLGEIALAPGASLRGRVVLPLHADPTDVNILATAGGRARSVRLDARAQFEFEDLVAGDCTLNVDGVDGALVGGPPIQLQLAPNDEREIVLDLRDREGMWLTVRVQTGGQPVARAQIGYAESAWANGATKAAKFQSIEFTQEDGAARIWLARSERVTLAVSSWNLFPLGQYTADVTFASNGDGYVELGIEVSALVVDWRAVALPGPVSRIECVLEANDDLPLGAHHTVIAERQALGDRRSELGPIAPDSRAIRLYFTSADGTTLAFRRSITCRAGERCECVFSDTDRVENTVELPRALGY